MSQKATVRQNHPGIVKLAQDVIELFGPDISVYGMVLVGTYLKIPYKPNPGINRWDLEFEISEILDKFKDQYPAITKLVHKESRFSGQSYLEVTAEP